MGGFQRFVLVVLFVLLGLIFFPQYTFTVWMFVAIVLAVAIGVLMVVSTILAITGLDRFSIVNTLFTLVLLTGTTYAILYYMPLEEGTHPIERLEAGVFPTREDIEMGMKRLTFNFDFNNRNARSEQNFANQQDIKQKEAAKQPTDEEKQKNTNTSGK